MGFWSSNKGSSSQPKQSARDQEADAEFAELIAALSQELSPNPKDEKKRAGRDRGEIDNDTAYTSTFPGEMNCITAFDEMFYCYSIGGQFLNGMSLFPAVGLVESFSLGERVSTERTGRELPDRGADRKLIQWRQCIDMVAFGIVVRRARTGDSA